MTEQRSCDARAGLEEDDDLQATLIKALGLRGTDSGLGLVLKEERKHAKTT